MALFSERRVKCAHNPVDRADIVREGIYRQLSCCGDENHAYGRMTLGVFPPDPKFRGYHAHQGRREVYVVIFAQACTQLRARACQGGQK